MSAFAPLDRRMFFLGCASVVAVSCAARGDVARLSLSGSLEQGSLVIGRTETGAKVMAGDKAALVSPEGIFAFGFDFDQTAPTRLDVRFADGSSDTRDVVPVKRQYEVQVINGLPERFVTPSPEELERIKRENAMIVEARKRVTAGIDFASGLDWPLPGIVSGVFGSQRILNGKPMAPHLGVDIAAPQGTPIHAPADALVSISDDYFLDGGFTLLDHGHGVSTCYLHQSKRMVAPGDAVKRGQVIGLVGMTGRATGPHTHWGMNWFQMKLDPSRSTKTPAPAKS